MSSEPFLQEVEKRLTRMFSAAKQGYKPSAVERHRLEGFMQAGVFVGLTDNLALSSLMSDVHIRIFGKTLEERQHDATLVWQEQTEDYSQYEVPAFIRQKT